MSILEDRRGSVRETLAIAFPLMLASLSIYLMYFVDRFILACFSLDALNIAVQASSVTWALWGGIAIMAGMSEIFVAQYRFANPTLIGREIWNSIWLSLAAASILIPIAFLMGSKVYSPGSQEYDYFLWSMSFGIFHPVSYALIAFFVGQGKTVWILLLTIATVLWNIVLDYAFIFGISSWIPSLGAKGAAIAGGISLALQTTILFFFFLKKTNRLRCGTNVWRPHLKILLRSIKISAPTAILYNIELWGWGLFYTMMAASSTVHITISSLCQSLIYLFIFISEGLYRGSLLQANNSLAQGKEKHLRKIFISASIILTGCFLLQLAVLSISPRLFLSSVSPVTDELLAIMPIFEHCSRLVLIYLLFQGIQWLLSCFLIAMGQTMAMMIGGSVILFGCLVLPTHFLIRQQGCSVEWAWGIVVFYTVVCCLFYGWLVSRVKAKSIPVWQNLPTPEQTVDLPT